MGPAASVVKKKLKQVDFETLDQVLELLGAHRQDRLKELLKKFKLRTTGTREVRLNTLREGVEAGLLEVRDLVTHLNEIESWGKQHIYLFDAPERLSKEWQDGRRLKETLEKSGRQGLLSKPLPLILPSDVTLASVEYTDNRIRLLWVEKRTWHERLPDDDHQDAKRDDIIYRAYKFRQERGVTVFEWNLRTLEAMLMIKQLSRGSDYDKKFEEYRELMKGLVDISNFEPLKLSKAIKALEHSKEVRPRQLNWSTESGGSASFKSSRAEVGYKADKQLVRARDGLGENVQGLLGNFYWKDTDHLTTEVHATIHGSSSRVAFGRQDIEKDVRHVLSRIRFHSK